jgi:cobalt-zinc-cadmium efflux system protein
MPTDHLSHSHSHPHGHNHHHESPALGTSLTRLLGALTLVLGFMLVELVAGWRFHSLALFSDGVHMFSDAASLSLAGAAAFLSRRRASIRRTYGYKRVEILAAFANSLSLLWLSVWLAYQAVDRFRHPLVVQGHAVLLVALMGLLVNVILLFWLHHGEGEHSLNEQGVLWHVIGDTLSSVAAVAAGGWISLTGWNFADPILALLVVAILFYGSIRLLLRSGHILVEGTPEGLNADLVRADLLAQPQVAAVHDLHLWTLNGRDLYASAHIATREGVLSERDISTGLTRLLTEHHHFDHVTLQVGHCDDPSQGDCGAHCGDPHP